LVDEVFADGKLFFVFFKHRRTSCSFCIGISLDNEFCKLFCKGL
jgi:hypothetical protein